MKRSALLIFLLFAIKYSNAQNLAFARKIVDTLSSRYFHGRGYTNDGLGKAADFLACEFKSYGLTPLNKDSYFQPFFFPVNTFPGKMEVTINNRRLEPGRDFIVSPESRGIKEGCKLHFKDSTHYVNDEKRIVISLVNKLTWSVAKEAAGYTHILIDKNRFPDVPQKIKVNIENKEIESFKSLNVCAKVQGTDYPDSMLVISAHYDHLGEMGDDTYFPGANDNASGISLLLNLVRYYATNRPKFSIVFLCFAGEEAGLVGSKYFTENPLIDLKKIRFLLNTDLAGTGEEGITVVNATVFKKEFELMQRLNDQGKYLAKIYSRGKAANSDHYWFTEKGVPSFFFYTMGGIKAYHDVNDRAATLPLTEHEDLFRLITRFNSALMQSR